MLDGLLYPPRASAAAGQYDALSNFELAVTVFFTVLIFLAVLIFALKYRRRRPDEAPPRPIHGSMALEITWSAIPFAIMLVMFFWGTKLYFQNYTPPPDTLDIYITGKQWMWKVQYPGGQREINELHVPVGRKVKLTLASEDVIHSFFVPAFRLKHDVVPGQYEVMWFEPTVPGRYHLFCAEYCGTNHSEMTGWVTVMDPNAYENWLSGGAQTGSLAEQGRDLFSQYGCATCHLLDTQGRCPNLRNVYGHPVQLEGGRTVMADEVYIRESIMNPNAKIVAGFQPNIMPNFQGQISEDNLLKLIAYIKSLSPQQTRATTTTTGANANPRAQAGQQ
jgi:cytochrome c oxidase subunit 2